MKSPLLIKVLILFACFVLTSCTKGIEIPTEGLILYYSFERNLNDGSGNNNNCINYTSNNYVAGIRGVGLDFNGTSDYMRLSKTLNSEYGLSFSFWIKSRGAASTENNGVIIGKYDMSDNSRCFMIYSFGAYETRNDNGVIDELRVYDGGLTKKKFKLFTLKDKDQTITEGNSFQSLNQTK